MTHETTVVGVRLTAEEIAEIERVADGRGCSKSDAIRLALTFGLPLARQGVTLNLSRIVLLLEYIQAGVDLIVTREHADFADRLEDIAFDRVETFHASGVC